MQVETLCDGHSLSGRLRDYVARRVGWTLYRFGERIGFVRVRLRRFPMEDHDEWLCGIAVGLEPSGLALARVRDRSLDVAIDRSIERAGHAVGERVLSLDPPRRVERGTDDPDVADGSRCRPGVRMNSRWPIRTGRDRRAVRREVEVEHGSAR